ncbi:glycine N-acyltransferase-like protein 2 [Homalodisca vitripennis]|uniref:glycine N-acyltransferase-like protein 2 n=1 Tax=Homalodisca vitripennis TaxID=197043 RepID=UPI001EEA69B0|nr:glycine N-acyltransferase-like protein 2 [Homalodisca vitripennis]XP_046673134.1 glycine N-acyltransferase-like protein 2 [Homalodisca vitripennis]
MEGEIFQEVKEENFAKVLEVLKQDWPKHFMLYQTIKVFEEYKKAGTEWKHNLYVYGDLETGVYLQRISAEYPNRNINLLYVYTTNPDLTELKKGLMETTIIPWHTHEYMFEMTPNSELDVIQEVLTTKNVTCDARTNTLFIYPPEKDLQMNPLPEDVYVDKLDVSHAAEVNRNWPHRHTGSELMLTEHILRNFGIGLFRRSDKKLLSSALSKHTGGLFVMYTEPEFRGKGYAVIVVQHMIQECRKRGRLPFCTVLLNNKASQNMFIKAGFEPYTLAEYIYPSNYFC